MLELRETLDNLRLLVARAQERLNYFAARPSTPWFGCEIRTFGAGQLD